MAIAASALPLAGVAAVVGAPAAPAAAATADATATITAQANWIASAQMPNGAIAVWPDRPTLRLVWPYLANLAAAGLASAAQVTGNAAYASDAWSYLRWYSGAEDPATGYVTDYSILNGTQLVSKGTYDSTDAYAGTFLAAAWDTYSATHDLAALQSISTGVSGAISAIASTQQPDGLTWATPVWHVAYLMDNAQVFGGLKAAVAIERVLGNSTLETATAGRLQLMRTGIASLWDPATGAYDWARQSNGWQHPTNWSNFYPDAMEQVSAVEWGAVPARRATAIMAEVASHQPQWGQPSTLVNYLNGATVQLEKASYWPSVPIAFNAVGDTTAATSGIASILSSASSSGYGWPYTTGDAGQAIIAASGLPLLAPTPRTKTASAKKHVVPRLASRSARPSPAPPTRSPAVARPGSTATAHSSIHLLAHRRALRQHSQARAAGIPATVAAITPPGEARPGGPPVLALSAILVTTAGLSLLLGSARRRRRAVQPDLVPVRHRR